MKNVQIRKKFKFTKNLNFKKFQIQQKKFKFKKVQIKKKSNSTKVYISKKDKKKFNFEESSFRISVLKCIKFE